MWGNTKSRTNKGPSLLSFQRKKLDRKQSIRRLSPITLLAAVKKKNGKVDDIVYKPPLGERKYEYLSSNYEFYLKIQSKSIQVCKDLPLLPATETLLIMVPS